MERIRKTTNQGGEISKSECWEMVTGVAVRLWSSSAAHLRQLQLRVGSTLSCRETTSRKRAEANPWEVFFGKTGERCVKRWREVILETQAAGQ